MVKPLVPNKLNKVAIRRELVLKIYDDFVICSYLVQMIEVSMQLDEIEFVRLENVYCVIRFEGQRNSKNAAPDHEVYVYYSTPLKSPYTFLLLHQTG